MTIKSVLSRAIAATIACSPLMPAHTAWAQATAQQKCDEARAKAWRGYVSCIDKVVANFAGGKVEGIGPETDMGFARCRHAYFATWAKLQGDAYLESTCHGPRFSDNGDGTVSDALSTLVWEKKDDSSGAHNMDNAYAWSGNSLFDETGTAFTAFLLSLNFGIFAGSSGWRLPTLAELQTIVLDSRCTRGSCICGTPPCVDSVLDRSTTQPDYYWSATSFMRGSDPAGYAWAVDFGGLRPSGMPKYDQLYVRAVRGGL